MNKRVLHVQVNEPMSDNISRAKAAMETLQRGETPEAYFGVGFPNMAEMLAVFSAKRMELVAYLRTHGPLTLAELTRHQGQAHENIESDVATLTEWMAIERDETGQLFVPWDEIEVHLPLVSKAA
jgi:predicted transcriptional regulator